VLATRSIEARARQEGRASLYDWIVYVTEPDRRGLHRRAPCSRVYLAYSLCQLRVGISPPYTLDPYDRSRNVLYTPRIHTFSCHWPRPVTVYKRGSKARERKGEEQQCCSRFYAAPKSRDCNYLKLSAIVCDYPPQSTVFHQRYNITPPLQKSLPLGFVYPHYVYRVFLSLCLIGSLSFSLY